MKGTIITEDIKNEKIISPKARGKKVGEPIRYCIIVSRENMCNQERLEMSLSSPIDRLPFTKMAVFLCKYGLRRGTASAELPA